MPRKKKSEPENQIENLYPIGDKLPTAPEQQTEPLNQIENLHTMVSKLPTASEEQQTEPLTQAENLDPIGSNMPFSNQDQQTEPLNQIENLYPMGYKLPDTEPQSSFVVHGQQITRDGANQDQQTEPQSNPRDYLTASLTSAQATIARLFEKQAELTGTQVADSVFDAFETAFVSRIEERLQPFMDVLIPEIKDTHTQLKERTTARVERRQSAFDRLKQIAATVTDECKLLPPGSQSVVAVGEFVSWEPIKEND